MVKHAVILAAGLGVRLKHRTQSQPKGFLRLHNFSLIERSIKLMKSYGIKKIFIGTGYLSEFFENLATTDKSITCIKSDRYETTGSMYTLYNMRDVLQEDFLLFESDLLYEKRAIAELVADSRPDIMLGSSETLSNDEVHLQCDSNGILEKVSKSLSDLTSTYAELVGVSKISLSRYHHMNTCFETIMNERPKLDYEFAMALSSILFFMAKKNFSSLVPRK